MYVKSLAGGWQFRQADTDEGWLPAQVPGGVHTDLMAAGRIPDPFVGDNELRVQWIAESDWEYRTSFDVDADLLTSERVLLVCDGLDTLAELTLNGKRLGGGLDLGAWPAHRLGRILLHHALLIYQEFEVGSERGKLSGDRFGCHHVATVPAKLPDPVLEVNHMLAL